MRIHASEQDVLAAEVAALLERLPAGAERAAGERLLRGIPTGEVPEADLPMLQRLIEAGLETGRIRGAHGAHAEMAAVAFFQRTPRGRALREAIDQSNAALAAFAGAELRRFAFALRGPGAYSLTLTTDRCHATLVVDRHAVRAPSLEVRGL